MPSPNIDPTLLLPVRKRLNAAITNRFEQLRKDIQNLIVKEDAFGFRTGDLIGNAASGRWKFLTSSQRMAEFKTWLSGRVDSGLLLPDPNAPPDAPWLGGFVQTAYTSGLGRSFTDAKSGGLLPKSLSTGTPSSFVSQTLSNPARMETLKLLYARNLTQLKGVSSRMADAMSIILADEFSRQSSPTVIAARLAKEVGIAANRAKAIAQTELTYAHAEGQLDAYEDMGLGDTVKLKVMVEWQTGSNPCESCAALRGVVLTIKEARGKIPMHPHCVVGDTKISTPSPISVSRAKYTGKVFEILTSKGRRLTVTENHVLLSQRGWVRARELTDSDHLIDASSLYGGSVSCPYNDQDVPRIADYFASLLETVGVGSKAVSDPGPEDFHGDGKFFTSKIDTVFVNRFLRHDSETGSNGQFSENLLVPRYLRSGQSDSLSGEGSFAERFVALASASDCLMGFSDISSILLRGTSSHHRLIGGGHVPQLHTTTGEPVCHNTSTHPERLGKGIDRLSGLVLMDHLLHDLGAYMASREGSGLRLSAHDALSLEPLAKITRIASKMLGHGENGPAFPVETDGLVYDRITVLKSSHVEDLLVFDMETEESIYVANGLVSSNCRCAWGSVNIYAPPTPGQKRSKKAIQEALNRALKTSTRKRTVAEARKSSRWAGASLRPTGKRTLTPPKGAGVVGSSPYLPSKDTRQTSTGVIYTPNNKTPARVREAGAAGVPIAIGGPDVSQRTGVLYTTQDAKGNDRTHVSLTVTPSGSRKITDTLGRDFEQERTRVREGQVHPQDNYFNNISSTSRMVEVRSKDGKYNEGLLHSTQKHIDHFSEILSGKKPSSVAEREMASHYLPQARAVLEAKQQGKQPPEVSPYRPAPSPMKTRKSPFPVEKTSIKTDVRSFGATPKDANRSSKYEGDAYRIQVSPNVSVQFIPHDGITKGAGAAFQGTLEVVVQGKPSRASVDAALKAVQGLGISTKPLTKAGEELAYLKDTVLKNGVSPKPVQKIANDLLLTDSQKVSRIKAWTKNNAGFDLRNAPPSYNPQGRSLLPSGRGPRVFDRWDINKEEIQGLLVQYTTASGKNEQGGSISSIVRQSLRSGGSLDPLTDRTRKGVPNPPGSVAARRASKAANGADLVTRIRKEGGSVNTTGLYFKPDTLLRTDASVYDGASDKKRLVSPAQWTGATSNRFNEARFKHGLSLLNDLEFIRVADKKEKASVLRAFKDMGITQLQDGRSVESIIAVRNAGNTYTKSGVQQ